MRVAERGAANCSAGQPAAASWLRARATLRSATPTTCRPRVSRACDEEHGAELAGADQADGDGPAGGLAFEQEGVKVHTASIHRIPQRGTRPLTAREGGIQFSPRGALWLNVADCASAFPPTPMHADSTDRTRWNQRRMPCIARPSRRCTIDCRPGSIRARTMDTRSRHEPAPLSPQSQPGARQRR